MCDFIRPRSSRIRTLLRLLIIWILAIIFAAPIGFLYNFEYKPDNNNEIKPFCSSQNPSWLAAVFNGTELQGVIETLDSVRIIEAYYCFATLYQYVFPMIYLSYAYTNMCLKLWNHPIPGNENENHSNRKSVKMMICIVANFAICWLPWHIFHTIEIVWPDFSM